MKSNVRVRHKRVALRKCDLDGEGERTAKETDAELVNE